MPLPAVPDCWIGYNDLRCDDPRGQFFNWSTQRAMLVRADGTGRRDAAPILAREPNCWTQHAGWSPDGQRMIILSAWEDPANYAWERANKTFRMTEGWRIDSCIVDLKTGVVHNPTAVERVSEYNTGLFFWPGDPNRLGFTALISSVSHPFAMNLDGTNKKDLTTGTAGFTYGYSASPDGKHIVYHKSYQVYLADADGGNAVHIDTGDEFQFGPLWSPDGKYVSFVAGKHSDCHPHIVRADGSDAHKLADRAGYVGWVELLDTPDFHSTSSDVPVWSADSLWIYYTANVGGAIELMRVSIDGKTQQLTHSLPGVQHYHPKTSPDGNWLIFGSNRDGARALYMCLADGSGVRAITTPTPGRSHQHAHWQGVAE